MVTLAANSAIKECHALMRKIHKLSDGQAVIAINDGSVSDDEDYDDENDDESYVASFLLHISPNSGHYKGSAVKFKVLIPTLYPTDPPKVLCVDTVYHPNIDIPEGGKGADICVNLLKEDWQPGIGLDGAVNAVLFLFHHPNQESALSPVFDGDAMDDSDFSLNVRKSLRGERVEGVLFSKLIQDDEDNAEDGEHSAEDGENSAEGGKNSVEYDDERNGVENDDQDNPIDTTLLEEAPTHIELRDDAHIDTTQRDGTPIDTSVTDDTPTDTTQRDGTPTDTILTGNTPTDTTQRDGTPIDTILTGNTPTDTTQRDGIPTDTILTGNTPTETTLTDDMPSDTTLTNDTHTDTALSEKPATKTILTDVMTLRCILKWFYRWRR